MALKIYMLEYMIRMRDEKVTPEIKSSMISST